MGITKYNVYLSEYQDHKVKVLAMQKGVEPEEIVNNAVYGYLAIVDPYAVDDEDGHIDDYTDEPGEKV